MSLTRQASVVVGPPLHRLTTAQLWGYGLFMYAFFMCVPVATIASIPKMRAMKEGSK